MSLHGKSKLLEKWSRSSPRPLQSPVVRDQMIDLDETTQIRVTRKRDSNVSISRLIDIQLGESGVEQVKSVRFRGIRSRQPSDFDDYDFYYDKTTGRMIYKKGDLIIME